MNEAKLIDKLRQTQRWRPEVEKTAASFAGVSGDEYEQLIRQLIESGDDKALGILLCVCGVNSVTVDPQVLAETLKMAEPVIDICFPYRVQGPDAIEPLLDAAQAEDISWERQALGAAIAAELAVRNDSRHQIVKNVLQKLSQKIRAFEANFLIDQSLALLDGEIEDPLEDIFDRILKKGDFDLQDEAKNTQIQKLKEKVSETNRLATQRHSALKEKELELDRLVKRFEGAEKSTASQQNVLKSPEPLSLEERKTASDLNRQINNLKAEINLQQHERRQLHKELREAQKKLRVRESRKTPTVPTDERTAGLEFETTPKKIMIPEFSAAYRRSCEKVLR